MLDCWVLAVLAHIRRSNLYKSDRFDLASRQVENPCELGQVHENFTYESNSFVINRGTLFFFFCDSELQKGTVKFWLIRLDQQEEWNHGDSSAMIPISRYPI